MVTAVGTEAEDLSAECALAARPGYSDLHAQCHQTRDIPLPHYAGILLAARCGCSCHRRARATR
ncbi:hypothetical protein ACFY0B_43675 [Streptomyces sp. NPDC001797]|uniref:Uncharacterized protein n=1 Tax=Streptomyces sp. 900105755 TaxID=3154389 RepID=A0ABV1TWA3_9ACTN